MVNLFDHARAAQSALSASAWAYFSGGAADEITSSQNEIGWQAWGLSPRVLRNLSDGNTRCELLGRVWPTPLLVAPMALQRWAHPEGESGMALAAAAQGCGMVLSHQTTTPLEKVAPLVLSEPNRGPIWFQLYWHPKKEHLCELISQIQDAGYEALVLTVDAPVQGIRDRERRHDMTLPTNIRAVHWQSIQPTSLGGLCQGLANHAPTWVDVKWLISQTRLPVLLKGITHPQDAQQALDIGVAGLIVSNHGGRVLDTMPPTSSLVGKVVEVVRQHHPNTTILVDGGIRRGTDLFKALALGADAILIGRPAIYGLAHGGALGVAKVLRQIKDEFEAAMALAGCSNPGQINSDHLYKMSNA
jgi:4-hydroxymandelate oxidase